jgi:hypothetical protein
MVEAARVVGMKQEPAAAESEVRDSTNSGRPAPRDEWLEWGGNRPFASRTDSLDRTISASNARALRTSCSRRA